MTRLSDLTTELKRALNDEVYDGALGELNDKERAALVSRLAEAAVEVFEERGALVEVPRVIKTEVAANALPVGSIICDHMGDARQKVSDNGWEQSGVAGWWGPTWVAFPAEVLWLPVEQEGETR